MWKTNIEEKIYTADKERYMVFTFEDMGMKKNASYYSGYTLLFFQEKACNLHMELPIDKGYNNCQQVCPQEDR